MSYVISIAFLAIVIYLITEIMLLPKKEEQLNFVKWFFVSILLLMCINAIISGIFIITTIKISLISVGIMDLILAIVLTVLNRKKKQKYYIKIYDIVAILVIFLTAVLCGFMQFGVKLSNLNFETSDPANHLNIAMDVVLNGTSNSMYLNPVNSGLFISTFLPFLGKFISVYRLYIIWELFMYMLSGIIVYVITRNWIKSKLAKAISILLIFVYMFAYPFNSMIFGFGYLSIGVTVAGLTLFLCDEYINGRINKKINLLFMSMALYGCMITYTLFAPVIFIITFISIVVFELKNKTSIKDISIKVFLVHILPGLVGSYFMIIGTFKDMTPTDALGLQGYIYTDLFINTIVYIPFVTAALIKTIKNKETNILAPTIFIMGLYMIFMFVGGMKGLVSSYYYSKNYYLLALVLTIASIYYIGTMVQHNVEYVLGYIGMCVLVCIIHFCEIEEAVMEESVYYNNKVVSKVFFSLYDFNIEKAQSEGYSESRLQLYDWVNENLNNDEIVPMAGYYADYYWYRAVTEQKRNEYAYHNFVNTELEHTYIEEIKNVDYIVVDTTSEAYLKYRDFFDSLEKVYENQIGFVGKIN